MSSKVTRGWFCRIAAAAAILIDLNFNGVIAWTSPAATSTSTSTNTQSFHRFTTQLHESDVDSNSNNQDEESLSLSNMATSRFPTSPEDQVRQASIAISAASKDGKTNHSIRLLLPIIGATELDDWPGGARQMMEAASPLIKDVLQLLENTKDNESSASTSSSFSVQESVIDQSDGVRALFSQANNPKDDACAVLLPSADTISALQELNEQVGSKRNFILVNSQWRRKSDFSGDMIMPFFGGGGGASKDEKIQFVENFEPTFHCSNVMVEGDIVRILRTYPGPWRVYLRVVDEDDQMNIDWVEIGTKDVVPEKSSDWEANAREEGREYDGGRLFDWGIPSYKDIEKMIVSREGYMPKSLSERAASAFTFIKDTL